MDPSTQNGESDTIGVHQVKVSPLGCFLAYTLQLGPEEACCARVRHLASGSFLAAGHLESAVSLEWLDEGHTLLYTLPDDLGRPYKVQYKNLESENALKYGGVIFSVLSVHHNMSIVVVGCSHGAVPIDSVQASLIGPENENCTYFGIWGGIVTVTYNKCLSGSLRTPDSGLTWESITRSAICWRPVAHGRRCHR